jgi:serine/threonine-protein kinase RsbW
MQHEATEAGAFASSAELHSVWAADPVHLPRIRALTRSWLAPLGLDADTTSDLVLAVNEAASNAVEHAYAAPGPADLVKVRFWTEPHHLHVEVADHGRWKAATNPGNRGRGILIMNQMVDSVVIHHDIEGTRVRMRHPSTW